MGKNKERRGSEAGKGKGNLNFFFFKIHLIFFFHNSIAVRGANANSGDVRRRGSITIDGYVLRDSDGATVNVERRTSAANAAAADATSLHQKRKSRHAKKKSKQVGFTQDDEKVKWSQSSSSTSEDNVDKQ